MLKTMSVKRLSSAFIPLFCCVFLALFVFETFAEGQSRWALGRPSLLIDLPADPRAESVAWAERSAFSFVPNSWVAEGNGVRFEVARIYTNNSPAEVLAEVGRKINVATSAQSSGVLSGRRYVNFSNSSRTITVFGADESAPGGTTWVVMAIYNNAAGMNFAYQLLGSLVIEREGRRNWALRSLGNTSLVAELPYDFSPRSKPNDSELSSRYEVNFDGMEIEVWEETPDPGANFEKEKTIAGFIEGNRSLPGVTNFTATREPTKLGGKEGEIINMRFKQGYRDYLLQKIAFIEKRKAIVVTIKTDPKRADHLQVAEKLFRTLRFSTVTITGWKNYAVGSNGLYMDLPKAPDAPKQVNAVTIYNVANPISNVEVREIDTSRSTAYLPDFSAKNYLDIQTALTQMKTDATIEKRLIDGIEARLIKITHTKDKNTYQRRILMIFAPSNNWIIDVMVMNGAEDYFERLLPSVRVQVPSPRFIRQSFGKLGVSFNVQDKFVKVDSKKPQNDPDFENEETAAFNYSDGNFFIMYEMTFKTEANLLTEKRGDFFANALLSGMMRGQAVKIKAYLRDTYPINIDGVEGLHLVFDIKAEGQTDKDSPMQADFVMLQQGKILWTVFVGTVHSAGGEGRFLRAQVLNKLRVGL